MHYIETNDRINLGGFEFIGPLTKFKNIEKQSGVYVILGKHKFSDRWTVVEVEESEDVYSRITSRDRISGWLWYSLLSIAVHYTDRHNRRFLERRIRNQYNPPCGKR